MADPAAAAGAAVGVGRSREALKAALGRSGVGLAGGRSLEEAVPGCPALRGRGQGASSAFTPAVAGCGLVGDGEEGGVKRGRAKGGGGRSTTTMQDSSCLIFQKSCQPCVRRRKVVGKVWPGRVGNCEMVDDDKQAGLSSVSGGVQERIQPPRLLEYLRCLASQTTPSRHPTSCTQAWHRPRGKDEEDGGQEAPPEDDNSHAPQPLASSDKQRTNTNSATPSS